MINNIAAKLPGSSLYEIPEYLDCPNYTDDPGSYLKKLAPKVINTYEDIELLDNILNSSNEIILTGGFEFSSVRTCTGDVCVLKSIPPSR